jgi:putative restriction endonuclease
VRYWWVNQNQTSRQEIEGGYLWSPKRNKNGRRNPFYEFMREVAPGDVVFSFYDTRIAVTLLASSAAIAGRVRSLRNSGQPARTGARSVGA